MWGFLGVVAFAGVVSAIPGTERETKFYDVAKTDHFASPLSSYFKYFDKGEDFKFSEDFFKHYPEEKICEFIAVYKPNEEKVLHGFYIRAENLSDYGDDFFNAVRPFYDYVNAGDFYGFSPLVAQKIAPEYFYSPLKNISYKHFSDVDLDHPIPLFFLVPRKEAIDAALVDKVRIDEKRFCHTAKIAKSDEACDLKEDDKSLDLTKGNEPADLPEVTLYDHIQGDDISHEPPYGLFMRSDPFFDIFPDPYLRFVPPQYETLSMG